MAHFLDPKYDLTFKRVFGEHKHLCMTEINENTEKIPQELLENELTREAVSYMEKVAYTKEQLALYDKWKIDLMSAQSMIYDAEVKGVEKGRSEGEAETLERVVLDAKRNGFSLEQTQTFTKLSFEQITEILKKYGHS